MRALFRFVLPYFILLTMTVVYTLPLLRHPTTAITDPYDGMFITWSINWSAYALLNQPLQFYNAPIFHPYSFATTFSDPMLSSGVLVAPLLALTHEPLLANVWTIFTGYLLTGIFAYLFMLHMTKRPIVALTTALLVSFGWIHTKYMGQLHTFVIQWILLAMLAWVKFLDGGKMRWLGVMVAAFLAQALNSPFTAYVLMVCVLPCVCNRKRILMMKKHWRVIALFGGFSILIAGLFYLPYFKASALYHGERTIRDAAHFALSLHEVSGTRGVPIALAVLSSICLYVYLKGKKKNGVVLACFGFALFCVVLSLGPVLKWQGNTVKVPFAIPLPYAVAYYIVPGFHAFRSPDRWLVAAHILLGVCCGMIVSKSKERLFFAVGIAILLFEHGFMYPVYRMPSRNERPPVYAWLERSSAINVVFIPPKLYSFMPNGAQDEAWRMINTLPWESNHVLHLYNGYSGFAPHERMDGIVWIATAFPQEKALKEITDANIDTLVIDRSFYKPEYEGLLQQKGFSHRYDDSTSVVFQRNGL